MTEPEQKTEYKRFILTSVVFLSWLIFYSSFSLQESQIELNIRSCGYISGIVALNYTNEDKDPKNAISIILPANIAADNDLLTVYSLENILYYETISGITSELLVFSDHAIDYMESYITGIDFIAAFDKQNNTQSFELETL